MEILRVEHLTKRYGQGEAQVSALDDVSFCVEQGEFVAIVGPSGSGKSTLLHLLGGVDRPTGGKVYVSDKDMYALDETALAIFRRRQIGLIYQFYNLIPVLNVEENITLPLLLDNRSVNTQQLDSMVEALGLKKRLQHLPSQLSGGQQQRVSIGRALMASPAIVLADEPTGNLDSKSGKIVINALNRINREFGKTIVMVTHDPQMASNCSRIILLKDGVILDNLERGEDQEKFYQEIIGRMADL